MAAHAASQVLIDLGVRARNWRGSDEGIRGIMDAVAIAGGTGALVELFASADRVKDRGRVDPEELNQDLNELDSMSRAALYDALPLCALDDGDWVSDHRCMGMQPVRKAICRHRVRQRNEAAIASHHESARTLWAIIMQEAEPDLRLRAAAAMGQMDEKHGLLLETVLDTIEAEQRSHAEFRVQGGHLLQSMLPYIAMQARESNVTSEMDARIRRVNRDEHDRLHDQLHDRLYRLLAFRFPEFELDASFSWTEFTVKLGLCAPRQAALSIGDQWIGFNIYIEICDQARAWIPYFGAPGYEIIIRNEFLAEITALKKRFTLLRAYLGQEGGPPKEAASTRRVLSSHPAGPGPHLQHLARGADEILPRVPQRLAVSVLLSSCVCRFRALCVFRLLFNPSRVLQCRQC